MRELNSTRLKELLKYDSETGIFTWIVKRRGTKKSKIAGTVHPKYKYHYICIDEQKYFLHRLAWFYMYDKWPDSQLDHINHNKSDNRIFNLREVTAAQNMQNVRAARNPSGLIGITFSRNRWVPSIRVNGVKKYLGVYKTPEEAHAAYIKAKRELHPFGTL